MKIILFKGGLGNQMFQYVFYNFMKSNNNEKIYGYYGKKYLNDHNGLELNNVFESIELPKDNYISNIVVLIYKIKNVVLRLNQSIGYLNGNNINKKKQLVYDGYWQNLDFFKENTISLFKFHLEIIESEKNQLLLKQISIYISISVHIRRGDYLKAIDIYGNICNNEYYYTAIDKFKNINNKLFIFFSDDIDWARSEFSYLTNSVFVDWNKGSNSYIDMYLMSKCKHNIIANSTFSWWGAYLNSNPDKKVIAPKKWFNSMLEDPNIIPTDWIRV